MEIGIKRFLFQLIYLNYISDQEVKQITCKLKFIFFLMQRGLLIYPRITYLVPHRMDYPLHYHHPNHLYREIPKNPQKQIIFLR